MVSRGQTPRRHERCAPPPAYLPRWRGASSAAPKPIDVVWWPIAGISRLQYRRAVLKLKEISEVNRLLRK